MLRPLADPGPGAPGLLLVAAVPPPWHGTNMANLALIEAAPGMPFRTTLLDISDHRSTDNLGRIDFENVRLALLHLGELAAHCLVRRPRVVYILLSQNSLAFLRDGLFILAARLLGGARVVAHLHGGNFPVFVAGAPFPMRVFVRLCLGRVSEGIVLGHCLQSQLDPWVRSTTVVANGTDCLRDDSPAKPEGPLRVLYLSNLFKSKGIVDLAAALRHLEERGQAGTLQVDIAGSWGDDAGTGQSAAQVRSEVEACLDRPGLAGRVRFHGLVTGEHKLDLLRRAHLFVLPSWNEGQPVSLLEAMAAGAACISTPVGSIPETLVDGVTGLLVPPRDPAALAAAIQDLATDRERCLRLGRAGRERYLERYTKSAFVDRMVAVFRKVAGISGGN